MKIDPKRIEQLDRAAQGVISDAVNSVSPVAGKVLDWKMARYSKAQYPGSVTTDKDMAEDAGPLKPLKMPAHLAALAPLNPLYNNPKLQQAARDSANGGHDPADDYAGQTAPTDEQLKEANKLAALAASESRLKAIKVGAKPRAFIDPLTVGVVAGNIALASGAAWGAGKVGDYIADKLMPDKPKKATEGPQRFADSTIDILPALGTLGAVGVATYAGSKLIGAGWDKLTKKKKTKVAPTADPHMDSMMSNQATEDDETEEYAESRAKAVRVGAKCFALHVSEDEYKKLIGNTGRSPSASSGTTPAATSSAAKASRSVTVDNTNWGARADQVLWEGVKQVTNTKDNPKKTVFFSERQFSGITMPGGVRVEADSPEDAKIISNIHKNEGAYPGLSGDGAYFGNHRVGTRVTSEDAAQQSRLKAIKVGARPKEFFDPLNAAIAAGIGLPIAYATGKAVDYVYDAVTGKKEKKTDGS